MTGSSTETVSRDPNLEKGQLVLLRYRGNKNSRRLGIYDSHDSNYVYVYVSSSSKSTCRSKLRWDLFLKALPKIIDLEDSMYKYMLYQEGKKLEQDPTNYEGNFEQLGEKEREDLLQLLSAINGKPIKTEMLENMEYTGIDPFLPIVNEIITKWDERQEVLEEWLYFGLDKNDELLSMCIDIFDKLKVTVSKAKPMESFLFRRIKDLVAFFTDDFSPLLYDFEINPKLSFLNFSYQYDLCHLPQFKKLKKTYRLIKKQSMKKCFDDYVKHFREKCKDWFVDNRLPSPSKEKLGENLEHLNNLLLSDYEDIYYKFHDENANLLKDITLEITQIKENIHEKELFLWKLGVSSSRIEKMFKYVHSGIRKLEFDLDANSVVHNRGFPVCSCRYKYGHQAKYTSKLQKIKERLLTALEKADEYNFTEPSVPPQIVYILLALSEVEGKVGRNALSLILNGSKSKVVTENNLQENSQYTKLSYLTQSIITNLINEAISSDFIYVKTYKSYSYSIPLLCLTPKGRVVANNSDKFLQQNPDLSNWKSEQILSTFSTSPVFYKKKMIRSILDHELAEVMGELFKTVTSKDWFCIFSVLLTNPVPASFTSLIFSLLLGGTLTRSMRTKAAEVLLNIHKNHPQSNIPVLVQGLLPLEKGNVKKILLEIVGGGA